MLLVAEVEPVLEVPVGADLAPEVPTNVEDLVPEVIIVIDAIVAVAVKDRNATTDKVFPSARIDVCQRRVVDLFENRVGNCHHREQQRQQ